jgi:hypothetical protein
MTKPTDPVFAMCNEQSYQPGITTREYFAALIMAGFSANPNPGSNEENAKGAVDAADALIKALNKQP